MIRTTSQIFHGLGFYWARQCNMYNIMPYSISDIPSLNDKPEQKHEKWMAWLALEIQKRALLGHYIVDGLIAQASGNPTSIRHVTNHVPLPADDHIFEAKVVDDWIIQVRDQYQNTLVFREVYVSLFNRTSTSATQHLSRFSIWVVLEGLQSLVSDNNDASGFSVGIPSQSDIRQALLQLYQGHIHSSQLSIDDVRDVMIRWHSICLHTAVSTQVLALQICNDFSVIQDLYSDSPNMASHLDINAWTKTVDARRALLHAMAIYEIIEQLPFSRTHAIHIPSAIFAAATVYAAFHIMQASKILPPQPTDWSEVLNFHQEGDQTDRRGLADTTIREYLAGSIKPDLLSSTRRTPLDDLNRLQVFMMSIAPVSLIAKEMALILSRWINLSALGTGAIRR